MMQESNNKPDNNIRRYNNNDSWFIFYVSCKINSFSEIREQYPIENPQKGEVPAAFPGQGPYFKLRGAKNKKP